MSKAETLKVAAFDRKLIFYMFIYGAILQFISVVGLVTLPFWILGFGLYYSRRYHNHLEAELTTRALRFKKGMLFQVEKTIPLDNITDLTFKSGPILRMFGISTLQVETAGQSSGDSSNMTLTGIIDAEQFRNAVMEQRDRITDRSNTQDISNEKMSEYQREVISLLRSIHHTLQSGS